MSQHKYLKSLDLHAPSQELIENRTGLTLTKLRVITLDGMGAAFPKVRFNNAPFDNPFGIVNADIANGKSGMITCLGFMTEIDTSAWTTNTSLYSDNNGDLTTVQNSDIVATVIKQDANYGILYVFALVNFITANQGSNISWDLSGNAGTNPLNNFIGTLDSQPIKIRTNNVEIAQFDVNGRLGIGPDAPLSTVHIKPYVGYADSGTRLDSFALTTNTNLPSNLYSIVLTNGSVAKITLEVTGRQSDGTERCSFTRSGLFYKEGGNVQLQGPAWQSDFTSKSNSSFNISYSLGTSTLILNVKAANTMATYWTGNIKIEVLKTDL
jgi:hypothetical protein